MSYCVVRVVACSGRFHAGPTIDAERWRSRAGAGAAIGEEVVEWLNR